MAAYFSIILVIVTLSSGLIWLADAVFFAPKRREKLAIAKASQGEVNDEAASLLLRESAIVETSRSIFPVIAFVLILRSFLYEPFQIPSGSMMPTLLIGDFILVEKFSYGIKDPVWRKTLVETGKPQRGDVAVFKYPENPKIDYIKRIVGLPGDRIVYRNKQLYIQAACQQGQTPCPELKLIDHAEVNRGEFVQNGTPLLRYKEKLGRVSHDILINPDKSDMLYSYHRQSNVPLTEFVVPKGQYFAMGDNRDNSADSRYWGFVPEHNLVGKAVAIWISFEFDRKASSWLPAWVPTGVRFNRIGSIT